MAKNIYTTASGKTVNIDQMRLLNEKTIAVGNMGVNARGDQITSSGDIIKSRNEIMKERRNISPVVRYNGHKSAPQETVTPTAHVESVPNPTIAAQESTQEQPANLRDSLANAVNIDLTNAVVSPKKTITRI